MERYPDSAALKRELEDAICDAEQGRLSPYWQLALQREYDCAERLSGEAQALVEHLDTVLQNIPQWSDEAAERFRLERQGNRLLFACFFSGHRSMAEVIRNREGCFSIAFVLDRELGPAERTAVAQKIQEQLLAWMEQQQVRVDPEQLPVYERGGERPFYPTLEQALQVLLAALAAPDKICG